MLAKAYQKYLYIPRPVSKRYPMDVQHRAKQFAPFAALRGFEEIVRKQEILYEQRKVCYPKNKNVDWIGSFRWFLLECRYRQPILKKAGK